jgi:ubiquinone/menaquinone biosynthesis C-methylase UbiE
MTNKKQIKEQFGANAKDYVKSQTHAKGASLLRLLELVKPQRDWKSLDIATATGHTAFAFSPHVAHVWATDITPEMLQTAKEQARERGIENVTIEYADAEDLPYQDSTFDLVTCRIAPHHFHDIKRFLQEAARVLRLGGTLAVVDNIVPSGYAGNYINAFEKLRDPSHGRCLSLDEWLEAFRSAHFSIQHHETLDKWMTFEFWAKRHNLTVQGYLLTMLKHAPLEAAEFFQLQVENKKATFRLREGIIIGKLVK